MLESRMKLLLNSILGASLSLLAALALAQTAGASPKVPLLAVDQSDLSAEQKQYLERLRQQFPSQGGHRCQVYGKPQVWCWVGDKTTAKQVFQALWQKSIKPEIDAIRVIKRGH